MKIMIPLWLKIADVKVNLKLSINEQFDDIQDPPILIDLKETLIYQLSGICETSRIIEIIFVKNDHNENTTHHRFSNINVILMSTNNPGQKYKGQFFYFPNDDPQIADKEPSLSLHLNVPELSLVKFYDALISKKISGLSIGIDVDGKQERHVGAFGPPDRDDEVYIEVLDGLSICSVKLTEIASIEYRDSEQ